MEKNIIPIPIEDAATTLGILDSKLRGWIDEDNPPLIKNHRGVLSVTKTYMLQCAKRSDYYYAVLESIRAENNHKEYILSSKEKERLYRARLAMINEYSAWIDRIIEIHDYYKKEINTKDSEGWQMAAYLLVSRSIALAKAGCEILKMGYWYSGSLLREIDETLDVAHYFKIKAENGDTIDLTNWFRQGVSPGHSKCRRAIAAQQSELMPEFDMKNNEYLLNELYQKKSKWTHPNFTVIREACSFNVIDNKLQIKSLCYGTCEHEEKLVELVDFYKSSVWTIYQQFMLLFIDMLCIEHRNEILAFDSMQKKI